MAQSDLKQVARCAARLEKARGELRKAILRANQSGESTRDIAPHAGMSHQKVAELLIEAREAERRRGRQAD